MVPRAIGQYRVTAREGMSEGFAAPVANSKAGFADLACRVVIEPQFDRACPFEHGPSKSNWPAAPG